MRINKYIASGSQLSRRGADEAIASGRVKVNGQPPLPGQDITDDDEVTLDGERIVPVTENRTILLNKPVGYVCSRNGQGSKTIYDLLPVELHSLNPVGRLDKDSSGLLLMTNDGVLAQDLTHPSRQKQKVYEVILDKPLQPLHQQMITDYGVTLDDGPSRFLVTKIDPVYSTGACEQRSGEDRAKAGKARHNPGRVRVADGRPRGHLPNKLSLPTRSRGDAERGEPLLKDGTSPSPRYQIHMHEGRNRQIRRTFAALGYTVTYLHRTHFGPYGLADLMKGSYKNTSAG